MATETRTSRRQKTRHVVVTPPEMDGEVMEVPVRRVAEYIPASFVAMGDGTEDALNDADSRIYKVSDNSIALVFNAGVLEFNIQALKMVLDRCDDMSETDLNEVLGLTEDEEDEEDD